MPKQLLRIFGDQSLLALTMERAVALVPEARIWIVTTRSQAGEIRRELRAIGLPGVRLLEEPAGRNTAAAIGLAAARISTGDPQGVMAVLPADHHIRDATGFVEVIKLARRVAAEGWLVTLGIRPTRPETGYGYIRAGEPVTPHGAWSSTAPVLGVTQFTEKPQRDTAEAYVHSGQFYWNSGAFVWRVDRFLEEMGRFLPAHHGAVLASQSAGASEMREIEAMYQALEAISVDHGILEHAQRVVMIPAEMGWSDVGSWASLQEVLPKDQDGNVLRGDIMALDTRESLVWSEDRLVAALGLEGLVVVDTPDALLVCSQERSQEVRKIADRLRDQRREEARVPREVLKPWGAYRVLDGSGTYRVKWIEVRPGERLSLQSHRHRSEHWVMVQGTATVTLEERVLELPPGHHVHIPAGARHRVENRGSEIVRLIEVQTGERLSEDDIIRYEDDYGRVGPP
jgi:mannose-1-phosphate guanylyltransferase/mannose-6-phosphate isomerase